MLCWDGVIHAALFSFLFAIKTPPERGRSISVILALLVSPLAAAARTRPPPPPGCRPALDMPCGLAHWTPAVHTAPACFHAGGPHDIAGALYDEPTKTWHLQAGCWSEGGWQHMTSTDLVAWKTQGAPRGFGGTGGMVHDDDGTIVAYAISGGQMKFWTATDATATDWKLSPTAFRACCNDPIVWKATGRWYATSAQHGAGAGAAAVSGNYGNESFFTSKALVGPTADWHPIAPFSWFADTGSLLIPGHPMMHEFVSPDFFQNISGDPTGAASVFMTSTYGPLADTWQNNQGLYNYAVFLVGSQPGGAGTAFVPTKTAAVDWSPFSPHNATPGGLDVAVGWGPTQYGCCPKTVADSPALPGEPGRSRRVLLGWLQNGCSSRTSIGISNAAENSLTLPRDLSLAPDGTMRQRFIPELQRLRRGTPFVVVQQAFPQAGSSSPIPLEGARGAQIEITGTVRFGPGAGAFGLSVLAGGVGGVAEHTDIVFDPQRQQVQIDRRNSSARFTDADVRGGPMPPALAAPGELRFHAYVDHSVVTVIAENQTALTVWVHPVSPNSTGVALFNNGGAGAAPPVMVAMEVWQLASV